MCVRFSRAAGVICVIAGAAFGALAFLSDNVSLVGSVAPVVFLGFGVAGLTRQYITVVDNMVIVNALIGTAKETYRLGPTDRLEFDGTRVFLVSTDGRRRLHGVTGWLARRRDWSEFQAWAVQRDLAHRERAECG